MSPLGRRLRSVAIPDEDGAAERGWEVVRGALTAREPVAWPRRHARPALATAVGLAILAGALSPPGRAVIGSLRDAIGREKVVGVRGAAPALFQLPTRGQVLLAAPAGPWIVQPDGSKRLLDGWRDASWSPHAKFVVATRRHELAALTPHGDVRWSLARRGLVTGASWSFEGFRVAYLNGTQLRVVVGNGTGDRMLVPRVAPVPPAWRPVGPSHVLAYVGLRGGVHVLDADTGTRLADFRVDGRPVELLWSSDGKLLAVRMKRVIRIYGPNGSRLAILSTRTAGAGQAAPPAAAFAPGGRRFAFVQYEPVANRSAIYVETIGTGPVRRLFGGPGHFSQLAWSPDGRWLLVAWPDANQLFFVRTTGPRKVRAVADVRRQFGGFPHLAGWCCAGE